MAIPSTISAYEPLTEDEATAWWSTITSEDRVQFIVDYDYVEHTVPSINGIQYTVIAAGQDIHMMPVGKMVIEIGHLSYEVELPSMSWEGFIPEPAKTFWRDFGYGFLGGVLASTVLVIGMFAAFGG